MEMNILQTPPPNCLVINKNKSHNGTYTILEDTEKKGREIRHRLNNIPDQPQMLNSWLVEMYDEVIISLHGRKFKSFTNWLMSEHVFLEVT